ncbi:glutamyl-tRNA reductase [Pelagibius litoralis]|uniref:Glutamyl-tRNA reductase n=1 Tax=Pelagibius litoralis TaxID=374515 RepID=A0A967F2U4_9PROT|nr:glutamyl-tRNA reductase [Pelagibius litoralis]NIA71871.1 glutamyl-tRNA reductase [Pelagibius litoralis]
MSDDETTTGQAESEILERLTLVGVNHRSLNTDLRERLFDQEPDLTLLLAALRHADWEEGLVVATCERLEFAVIAKPGQAVAAELLQRLAGAARLAPTELVGQSYCHSGPQALRHLFAVAASLDSLVVGEPQILGQMKQCYRAAAGAGLAGPRLDATMQAAFAAAKRVRSETPIGQQASSMNLVATQVAEDLHGRFDGLRLLWLGLGEMGEMLCADFIAAGVGQLLVTHGSSLRAEAAARRLKCNFAPWDDLDHHLAEADIVVSDSSSGRFTLETAQMEAALRHRRRRPVLLIDAGVPSDIDPAIATLEGAFVYDLDDLERLAKAKSGGRAAANVMAWSVLEEELDRFQRAQAGRNAAPSVVALRQHFEATRRAVLEGGRLDAEEATRLLVNKLLHDPSEALRRTAAADRRAGETLEASLRRLFGLTPDAEESEEEK